MGKDTGISWTDHTFNPWWGCTKVSAGCDNCYAETWDARTGGSHWGKGAPRRTFGDKHWNEPLAWNKAAEKAGKPAMVFCASMADIMDDEAPEGQLERLWALIDSTPHLIWQLLTKRPQRYERKLPPGHFRFNNVWLGTTTEDQANYDLRWPIVHRVAVSYSLVAWISYEPAIGPLTMYPLKFKHGIPDWVIFGGESGNGRRTTNRYWAERVLVECRESGSKFFMKQMGGRTPTEGKAAIPADLMIQQFPILQP